jgi:hypothetical protein
MWSFNGEEVKHVVPGYYGFTYRITNLIDQRQYLGRKVFWFRRKKKVFESDWRDYFGSSKELLADFLSASAINFAAYDFALVVNSATAPTLLSNSFSS